MAINHFEVLRAGINTTFQDEGRNNLYHIGIPFSGAMDYRNYLIANKLVGNESGSAVIEFALQGPLLKYKGSQINIAISGDVNFELKKGNKKFQGNCYESYTLDNNDEINILSTNKSVYGYLSINGIFDIKYQWGSCSVNTKANIGSNSGQKIKDLQKINIKKIYDNFTKKKLDFINTKIENIRVIKGTNFNYFSENSIKDFFSKDFRKLL